MTTSCGCACKILYVCAVPLALSLLLMRECSEPRLDLQELPAGAYLAVFN